MDHHIERVLSRLEERLRRIEYALKVVVAQTKPLSKAQQKKINQIYAKAVSSTRDMDEAMAEDTAPGGPRSTKRGNRMADKSIDELLQAVTDEDGRVDSLIALFAVTKQQLQDALSGVTLPPGVQAKINNIFDLSTAAAAKIDTALNA